MRQQTTQSMAHAIAVSPESYFLQNLFARLAAHGVSYAVMRNHEALPYSARGSDLDLIVSPQDAVRARAALLVATEGAGGVAIGTVETVGFFKAYIIGSEPETAHQWWGLRVDLNIGLYFKGMRLLSENAALPVRLHNSVAVLSNEFAGLLGVLKEVLNNGTFPTRYGRAARAAAQNDWPRIAELLTPMGSAALAQLHEMVTSDATLHQQKERCSRLRRELLRHKILSQPLEWVRQRLRFELSKVQRYLKPPGVMIAFHGVDGAGKSTVIDAILPALNAATHDAVLVKHLRPGLVPPLARLRSKSEQVGPVRDPHGARPSGLLGSAGRLVYLMADYVLGYWLLVRPKIARHPTVILFDRYAYDLVLDPMRFRIGLPVRLIGPCTRLVPKPDIVFCLHAPPQIIATRKPELPFEEIGRQLAELKAFAVREPRAVLISTESSVEEARDRILVVLRDWCLTR